MKLTFHVNYHTKWGENLYICGNIPALGNGIESKAVKMDIEGDRDWRLTIDVGNDIDSFSYIYLLRREDGTERHEWGAPHTFITPEGQPECFFIADRWQDIPEEKPFYSKAFTEGILRRPTKSTPIIPGKGMLTLRVEAPTVRPGQTLRVCGSCETLGCWNPAKAPKMNDARFPIWELNIPLEDLAGGCDFKFVIADRNNPDNYIWEEGHNRHLNCPPANANNNAASVDVMLPIKQGAKWRGAGTEIPVFSLRSSEDMGIGDFLDIKLMADWASRTGQCFIQLLPINDTTMTRSWLDSYPYNAISSFALNPILVRPSAVGRLKAPERREHYAKLAQELNALKEVDYPRVLQAKEEYCREIFAEDGEATLGSAAYREFFAANSYWLLPYAAYCVLRDRYNTSDFSHWGDFAHYSEEKVAKIFNEYHREAEYWCFIQYHLSMQMHEAHDYASARGVALKGDIPIGISRTSVDAWMHPYLFYLDTQAGAPPDDFSVLGQNWGFPTYNWEEMAKDGFEWWKSRFRTMAQYFDAYRVDHILGFFRIWQIPMDAIYGLLGIFHAALPYSAEELRDNYGFHLDPRFHTTPYIMDHFLPEIFGEYAYEAAEGFMNTSEYGRRHLKPEFNTQRKVADYFAKQPDDNRNRTLCQGLMRLIEDVLFIEDPYEKGKYHPRITAQTTRIYRALPDEDKKKFDYVYNDFFYRRNDELWQNKAMWKLPPLIDATSMLTCAEDLGMIPGCVPAVLDKLRILAL